MLYTFVTLFVCVEVFYICYGFIWQSKEKPKSQLSLLLFKIVGRLLALVNTLLFIPVLQVFLHFSTCSQNSLGCQGVFEKTEAAIGIICSVLFFKNALLGALVLNPLDPFEKNHVASPSGFYSIVTVAVKIFVSLNTALVREVLFDHKGDERGYLVLVVFSLLSIKWVNLFFLALPMSNVWSRKVRMLGDSLLLYVYSTLLLQLVVSHHQAMPSASRKDHTGFIIAAVGLLPVSCLSSLLMMQRDQRILNRISPQSKGREVLEFSLIGLRYLSEPAIASNMRQLMSVFDRYRSLQIESEKLIEENFDWADRSATDEEKVDEQRNFSKDSKQEVRLCYLWLEKLCEKNADVTSKLLRAYIYHYKLANRWRALYSIHQTEKQPKTLVEEASILRLMTAMETKMLEKKKQAKDTDHFDLFKFYRFQTSLTVFHRELGNIIKTFLNFNSELAREKQNLHLLSRFGAQISRKIQDVHSLYKELCGYGFQNTKMMEVYALFKSDIMFDDAASKEIIEQIRIVIQKKAKSQMNLLERQRKVDEDTPYLIISASGKLSSLGQILSVGSRVQSMFGFSAAEVQGENVKVLMPKLTSKYHDSFVKRYFESGKARIMGEGREVFGQTKSGYINYCELFLSVLPQLKEVDSVYPGHPDHRDAERQRKRAAAETPPQPRTPLPPAPDHIRADHRKHPSSFT